MAFHSMNAGVNGFLWTASCQTVQDLETDPSGNTIYAEGTVTVFSGPPAPHSPRAKVFSATLSNRHTEHYTPADAQRCLNQLLFQLAAIGRQTSPYQR
jgi:hypothetical protein